jgi:hypothetical protein
MLPHSEEPMMQTITPIVSILRSRYFMLTAVGRSIAGLIATWNLGANSELAASKPLAWGVSLPIIIVIDRKTDKAL